MLNLDTLSRNYPEENLKRYISGLGARVEVTGRSKKGALRQLAYIQINLH